MQMLQPSALRVSSYLSDIAGLDDVSDSKLNEPQSETERQR